MRSRATNLLQAAALFAGIVYLVVGSLFYLSPILFSRICGMDVGEDWLTEIPKDPLMSTLYYMATAFASLLGVTGASMVLPLFDPEKYRVLMYFTGAIFPGFAAVTLLRNGIRLGHPLLIVFGGVFLAICVVTVLGIAATRHAGRPGGR
ncbi:MAG TPA: hypothetical protein PKM65_14160 [Spirochaetota bacterium]|nr:hypothetical protein [Spirochaetota bacterium]HNT12924.1 hypothetical protein [Spirochaetota bacterium]HNV48678.1 hypothetical protein [Spirochaetota bacterium]HOS38881.1 hypothetical protein [Spirochaetota bacterium]HPU87391.1 hypothetical protein [Spirochaetota bacterium]